MFTLEELSTEMPSTAENAALGIGFERALPKLGKGEKCRIWVGGRFWVATVVRRMPGPCYWVSLDDGKCRGTRHIVHCGNWGGRS